MGMLMDGQWETDDGKWASKDGEFRRGQSVFRCHIGDACFPAERDRYHLYVHYSGRVTVPILWDEKEQLISNYSACLGGTALAAYF